MNNQLTFQDPYNLTDEEIDNLCIFTGTYKQDASEDTKAMWRETYRNVEAENNEQIRKAGGVDKWYESGEGRLFNIQGGEQ